MLDRTTQLQVKHCEEKRKKKKKESVQHDYFLFLTDKFSQQRQSFRKRNLREDILE
jgi:hypothetical protein